MKKTSLFDICPSNQFLPLDPKTKLYHYTDLNALLGICRSDKIILRATSCLYLNDYKEFIEGRESLVKAIGIDPTSNLSPSRYFVTSFSKNCDSLPMWNMYGANGNGIALIFHADDLRNAYKDLLVCTYGQEELQREAKIINIFSKSVKDFNNGTGMTTEQLQDSILYNLCLCHCISAKNEAFRYEQEIRGVYRQSLWSEDDISQIRFRHRNGVIIPYYEIELPKTALKGIVFGPTANLERTQESVCNYLSELLYGYENVYEIVKSKIPYIS